MIYYIDFDCTLYDTEKLINEMIERLADALSKNNDYNEVFDFLTHEFKTSRVPDVFKFCGTLAEKYNSSASALSKVIKTILSDGSRFVYDDVLSFFDAHKTDKVKLLTFSTKESTEYQKLKIKGSGLEEFFDEIIITSKSKGELDIDYKSGIFIDDSPKAIADIFKKKPLKLVRINRENSTHFAEKLPENITAPEFKTLSDLD